MPICVTGMHRSGTSMVARVLNLCGLYLGPQDRIMPPKPDNPEGFWENIDVAALNENILLGLGGRWSSPPSLAKDGWELDPVLIPLKNKAADFAQEFIGHEPWGWKDPRTSITLPFWNQLFPNLKLVICLRNPLAVAGSLHKRNKFSESDGIQLWQTYNQRLLAAALPGQYVITHYDAYFTDPKTELLRVINWLGWQVSAETVDGACKTISSSLRHNLSTTIELEKAGVPSDVLRLYADMCQEASWTTVLDLEDDNYMQMEKKTDFRADHLYETAQKIISKERYQEAIAVLERLLKVYPKHVSAHNDLGVLYFQKGDNECALEYFNVALQLDPQNTTAKKNIADLYLNLGLAENAVQILENLLTDNPKEVETLLLMGDLCCQAGRSEDAVFFYEKVLKIRSDHDLHVPNPQTLQSGDTR